MRNFRLYIPFLIALAILSVSCQKEEDMVCGDRMIEISSPEIGDVSTRGLDPYPLTPLKNFAICAIWNYDGVSQNTWYLYKQTVVKDTSMTNPWYLNPSAYWPVAGDLSFFAYAPSYDPLSQINFVKTATGYPKVEYTPSTAKISDQLDFLVGKPVMHLTPDSGAVPVHFNHALTQVLFRAKYQGTIPPGYFMLIDEIRVKGVVGTKNASYSQTAPYITWEDESARSADTTYTLTRTDGHLKQMIIPNTSDSVLYDSYGRLYLLPQTLGATAKLEVVYGFYSNSIINPVLIAQFSKEIDLPVNQVWPIGKTVVYRLIVDVGISNPLQLTATITDWVDSGNSHSEVEYE